MSNYNEMVLMLELVNLKDQIKELRDENAKLRECVVDFVLEQEHMPNCQVNLPPEVCNCMDRRYYNYGSCIERANKCLKDIK